MCKFILYVLVLTCMAFLRLEAQIQILDTEPWTQFHVAAQDRRGKIVFGGKGVNTWREWEHVVRELFLRDANDLENGFTKALSFEQGMSGDLVFVFEKEQTKKLALVACYERGRTHYFRDLQGSAQLTQVFMDSRTNIWATEAAEKIVYFPYATRGREDAGRIMQTLPVDAFWPNIGSTPLTRFPISMTEDARGRVWFWSNFQLASFSNGALRGVLLGDQNGVTIKTALPGVPEIKFVASIASVDTTNLWIALRYKGIYSIDLETLCGVQVAEPEPKVFRAVQKIFSVGSDCYVITGDENARATNGLSGVLWRRHGGVWQKVVEGLDYTVAYEQWAERRWLATPQGLWLTGYGTGGWFVPANGGQACQINWKAGLPFSTVDRWFIRPDGQLLGLQFGQGGFLADEAVVIANCQRKARAQPLYTNGALQQTADGKIYGFMMGRPRILKQWDGQQWHDHTLPENNWHASHDLVTDSLNRVWLVYSQWGANDSRPCFIFNPSDGKSQYFFNFKAALQAHAKNFPVLYMGQSRELSPIISSDGRICFEDKYNKLYYYNGRSWLEWSKDEIGGQDADLRIHPSFDSENRLCVWIEKTQWTYTELEGWHKNSTSEREPVINCAATSQPAVAAEILNRASSIITDRLGAVWFTLDKQLFRSAFGKTEACFRPNEADPFLDGRKLVSVLLDNEGNALLLTRTKVKEEYIFVSAVAKPPETTAKTLRQDGTTFEFEMQSLDTGKAYFSWRVDDGPWSVAQSNRFACLDSLQPGNHRFQAVAINEQFQNDPTPARVFFEVSGKAEETINHWIIKLGDKDFAQREAAVRKLVARGKLVLPALHAARERETDPDRLWWLDSAIQQCE